MHVHNAARLLFVGFYPSMYCRHCIFFCAVTGPLKENQIAYILKETVCGLHYLHHKGKMHRDIKVKGIFYFIELSMFPVSYFFRSHKNIDSTIIVVLFVLGSKHIANK